LFSSSFSSSSFIFSLLLLLLLPLLLLLLLLLRRHFSPTRTFASLKTSPSQLCFWTYLFCVNFPFTAICWYR
jgi:hypothetical protein